MEDAEDKVWPAGQQNFNTLSEHPATDTSKVLNVIAVVGLVDKGHDVTLLSLLEAWQLAHAKVCMIDVEEGDAVKAAPNNLFSLSLRHGGLASSLQMLQESYKKMNEYHSQAQHLSPKYPFPTMITQMKKHNDTMFVGLSVIALGRSVVLPVQ